MMVVFSLKISKAPKHCSLEFVYSTWLHVWLYYYYDLSLCFWHLLRYHL